MKKTILMLLVLFFLVGALTACRNEVLELVQAEPPMEVDCIPEEFEPEEVPEPDGIIEPVTLPETIAPWEAGGVTSAYVQIRFVEDETTQYVAEVNELFDLSQIEAYHSFVDPGTEALHESGQRIVFTADTPVSDFRFLALGYEKEVLPTEEGVLYALDALTPERPFVVEWVHVGCFTSFRGISFVVDGETRYFEIVMSNKDGRLFLVEFEPS